MPAAFLPYFFLSFFFLICTSSLNVERQGSYLINMCVHKSHRVLINIKHFPFYAVYLGRPFENWYNFLPYFMIGKWNCTPSLCRTYNFTVVTALVRALGWLVWTCYFYYHCWLCFVGANSLVLIARCIMRNAIKKKGFVFNMLRR